MPKKIFSIYSPDLEGDEGNENLIIEVAKTHFACLAKSLSKNTIAAFEIFELNDGHGDFTELFSNIQEKSKILHKGFKETKVFIQGDTSILVPRQLYTADKAEAFLDTSVGIMGTSKIIIDELDFSSPIVNVFSMPAKMIDNIAAILGDIIVEHTYSQILRLLFTAPVSALPEQFLKVQFYNKHFIVAAIADNNLQLIRHFEFEVPRDVLYHLLYIAQQLKFSPETLVLQISGMVDLASPLYAELQGYFTNLEVEQADKGLFHLDASEFPAHYFTPIFNLAV